MNEELKRLVARMLAQESWGPKPTAQEFSKLLPWVHSGSKAENPLVSEWNRRQELKNNPVSEKNRPFSQYGGSRSSIRHIPETKYTMRHDLRKLAPLGPGATIKPPVQFEWAKIAKRLSRSKNMALLPLAFTFLSSLLSDRGNTSA